MTERPRDFGTSDKHRSTRPFLQLNEPRDLVEEARVNRALAPK